MKHVTFTRDKKPYQAGGMAVLPDELAARLEAEGAIERNPPAWPAGGEAKPALAHKPQTYLTKAVRKLKNAVAPGGLV
jgi:hypothetical protein